MASEVGICSNALRKLGDEPITSLTDNSDRARLCNNFYPQVRNELLELRNWNFATARTSLAYEVATPEFTWSYQYQLPSDCIRPIRNQYIDEDYKVEGRKILTNSASLNLIYLKKETDPNQYTPTFITALEDKMAAWLAYPVTGDIQLQALWEQKYEKSLKEASYMDAISGGTPQQLYAETLIDARTSNTGFSVERIDL